MKKCFTPCIFYHESHNKSKKPSVVIGCNYKEIEIKFLSEEEISTCSHFKRFKTYNRPNKLLTE